MVKTGDFFYLYRRLQQRQIETKLKEPQKKGELRARVGRVMRMHVCYSIPVDKYRVYSRYAQGASLKVSESNLLNTFPERKKFLENAKIFCASYFACNFACFHYKSWKNFCRTENNWKEKLFWSILWRGDTNNILFNGDTYVEKFTSQKWKRQFSEVILVERPCIHEYVRTFERRVELGFLRRVWIWGNENQFKIVSFGHQFLRLHRVFVMVVILFFQVQV